MKASTKRSIQSAIFLGGMLLVAFVATSTAMPTQAKPLQYPPPPPNVYVCRGDFGECYPGGPKSSLIPYENDYVATVLKNEWGSNSNHIQALYAGAIAIRTFGQRAADGCGAIAYTHTDGNPVENDVSQRYYPASGVYQINRDAANNTAGLTILRFNDNQVACAKHYADAGNPTGSYSDGGSPTDTAVPDNVSISYGGHNAGVGQNGSIAWSIGSSNIRLNWPQILGKYYTRIGLSAGTNNTGILIPKNNYRWTWADVTSTIDWIGIVSQQSYHSAKANTPTTMRPNCPYWVTFTVFNGSKVTFYSEGSANPTRLSYHWYNSAWQQVTWDGIRTVLGGDLGFGQQRTLSAQVRAPSTSGYYYLTWDLVQEWITWHEWKNGTRQVIGVSVSGTPCP